VLSRLRWSSGLKSEWVREVIGAWQTPSLMLIQTAPELGGLPVLPQSIYPFINTILILLLSLVSTTAFMWALLASRKWTGPHQEAEIQELRMRVAEHHSEAIATDGNLKRVERDLTLWRREYLETNQATYRELVAIRESLTDGRIPTAIQRELVDIKGRVGDLEQAVSAIQLVEAPEGGDDA